MGDDTPVTSSALPVTVAADLHAVGLEVQPEEIAAEHRGDRIMARLSGGRIAWLATTPAAADRLSIEDKVLRLIGERCSFRVPAVLAASERCSLRSTVPGTVDPNGFADRLRAQPSLVPAVAEALARILAEQHTCVTLSDVDTRLPRTPAWPPPREAVERGLSLVVRDAGRRRRITALLDVYAASGDDERDCALVHGDFGLHNVAFDPATGAVSGVFDYGDVAWADRHLDFRFLVFAAVPDELLDAAIVIYLDATGIALDRYRILLCNAAAAIGHLADRAGHGDEELLGGRTLAGDLRWTDWALRRAGM